MVHILLYFDFFLFFQPRWYFISITIKLTESDELRKKIDVKLIHS